MTTIDYDVCVIGAGVHGSGVAQAAAAAGYRVLVIEEREPAFGTSSRSSKLIHGGLRYLETAELGLVRESLAERALLLRLAPDLVRLVPFFIPVYARTRRRPWQIRAGLSLYALLGNLAVQARFSSLPRSQWDSLDGLDTTGLEAVFQYFDGQTDDRALVCSVLACVRDLGATIACPAGFRWAQRDGPAWRLGYAQGESRREIRVTAIVNAAGPWIDGVQAQMQPQPPRPRIELVAGAHIELSGALQRGIYYTEAPRDGRAVFIMPWKGRTLVGTTERAFHARPETVAATAEEIDYLRETWASYFPGHEPTLLDSWAGLRVLPGGASTLFRRTREVQLVCDDRVAPHLVAIYGGKLTAYRSTAIKVMRLLHRVLPVVPALADTAEIRLLPVEPGSLCPPRTPSTL